MRLVGILPPGARHIRTALLAALAALLLAAGALAPTHASASEEPPDGETITTVLHPGWNMVGWVGPETPTRELFDALPTLRQASAWDAEAKEYRRARRRSETDLPMLTPGMGLWLLLGGNAPVSWTRAVSDEGVLLPLHAGLNLVGWTGDDGTPVGEAVARIDGVLVDAWSWEAATQQYSRYRPARTDTRNALTELERGDAVWVMVSERIGWWQPGSAKPPFTFLGDVPPETQTAVLTGYQRVQAFFEARFGALARGRHQYVAADREAASATYRAVFGEPFPDSAHISGRGDGVSVDIFVLPRPHVPNLGVFDRHYIEALISESGGGTATGWLVTGTIAYADFAYRMFAGRQLIYERDELRALAQQSALPLREFDSAGSGIRNMDRALAFFAVEWLAKRAGDRAVFEYFRWLRDVDDWRHAFAAAFGLSADAFFDTFAAYRANAFRPLAHLTDDLAEPVVVVLDGVPSGTASRIRTEFERVRSFFADRFEAEATEFTLYVAPDPRAATAVTPGSYDARHCRDSPLDGRAVVTLPWCGDSPPLAYLYVGGLIRELARNQSASPSGIAYSLGPAWFGDGAVAYAEAAYGERSGMLPPGEFRAIALAAAAHETLPLRRFSDLRDGRPARPWPTKALGFLAVEWLANHAGDPAVFEYYRVLPSSMSREAAFEQAFGLTLEDFYERFEAYRAELVAQ